MMTKSWIMIVGLAMPLLATQAAYAQNNSTWKVDPMTQQSGSAESKSCAVEAKRMEREANDAPEGRKDRTPNAIYHAQLAAQYATEGNEQKCWDELGLAQNYLD
jgi:hypothetical protein